MVSINMFLVVTLCPLSNIDCSQGTAIRGRHMLNLDLPSMVWKPLVGQPVTRADLEVFF